MLEAKPIKRPLRWAAWQDRVGLGLVAAFQIVALLAFAGIPVLAQNWVRTPFIGGFVEHTLVFNGVTPMGTHNWAAYEAGIRSGDQLVAINGETVFGAPQIQQVLSRYQPDDRIPVTIRTASGELQTVEIRLSRFPGSNQLAFLYIPYVLGLIYLGCGLWVFNSRRRDAAGRAFSIFSTGSAIALAGLFDLFTTHRLTPLWTVAVVLAAGGLFNTALLFPREVRLVTRYPFLRWIVYVLALALAFNALITLYDFSRPSAYVRAWRLEYSFLGLAFLFFLGSMVYRRYKTTSPIARAQARLVLWGAFVSAVPLALWFLTRILRSFSSFSPFVTLLLGAIPLSVAYAILRYRLLNTDYILSRTALYALLTIMASATFALLVAGVTLLLGRPLSVMSPALVGLFIVVLALLLNPIRDRLQQDIDRIFFRGERAYRERLQAFSRELTQSVELPAIIAQLRSTIEASLLPIQLHIYIHDPLSDQYVAAADADGPTSDIRFPSNSSLVHNLAHRKRAFFLDQFDSLPQALQSDWARMSLLGAEFFVPLPGQGQLIGWLALGPRRSGESYTDQDLAFLAAVSDQAALAIERAQVVANLERRVHEMNVLTRVAQGVNITLAFDDILELVYAQTTQVVSTRDFRITLYDKNTKSFYHAINVTDNERLTELENNPLQEQHGLAVEVAKTGRAIITDDYSRECRSRARLPDAEEIYAWIGVALNVGAETIGSMSIGSREPAEIFTDEQRDFLQAIADQAAGAIAKTQLLQETQRRARQLGTLNDVARSLASTLELDRLLNQILLSAVQILNCEAGSLFLVDESTEELIFRATAGPVASDLLGQRLRPGTGLVGRAVESGKPIIVNDVQKHEKWSNQTDQHTGFVTQAVLIVPLQVKDQTIGVIEVINKQDGSRFTMEEQELLTVFTGQAAVAIENARLYTMTDQALAARVEELSVMQRIDRELNASLDMGRAMRITLDWALRQSASSAGFIALIEAEDGHIMALEGYDGEALALDTAPSTWMTPALKAAIHTGEAQLTSELSSDGQGKFHPEARSQLVIPIRREADVIGVLVLENPNPDHYQDEQLAFLNRLSDHAAIAISNAQLYAVVQEANIAKSDFVSFVSHELKTPMTSIKGYADLLATGAVGAVNEGQANFLSTIRSNVNRMATLVSDLADISRIEAGQMRLEFSAVSIPEIVEEVTRTTSGQIEEKGLTLQTHLPDGLPLVWADRTRLIQILTNLVSNAYKYTPKGGQITLHAIQSENTWDPEGAPEVLHFWVQDTGIGISPQDQEKIFQKFFRSEDEKAREAPGTGLGLNITRSLIEMQGGSIWFESQYRKGTTFHFTIPVVKS